MNDQVELAIYDVLGQKVRSLVDGEQVAGYHTAVWNGRNVQTAAGVYFYRLRAGDFVQVHKLLLLK